MSTDAPAELPTDAAEPTGAPEERHATVLCVANQKGGVGKTTTTVSLAAALALEGAQVLVVDLDPQGNATTGLGLRGREGAPSTYRVLIEQMPIEDAAEPTGVRGLHCVPSSLDLAGAEIELVSVFSREQRLRNALNEVRDLYDVVLVDCPPSLGLLTINALVAADQVVVPIQCEYYALEGLGQLMRTLELVKANLNSALELGGVVLTMYDARTRLSQQVVDEVREHFGATVYDTIIPRTVRLSEAPGFGQPINVFDPSSRGARAYQRLGQEAASRLGLQLQSDVTPEDGLSALDRLLGSVSGGVDDHALDLADELEDEHDEDLRPDEAVGRDEPEAIDEPATAASGVPTGDVRPGMASPPAPPAAAEDREELPPGHADRLRDAATAAFASFRRDVQPDETDDVPHASVDAAPPSAAADADTPGPHHGPADTGAAPWTRGPTGSDGASTTDPEPVTSDATAAAHDDRLHGDEHDPDDQHGQHEQHDDRYGPPAGGPGQAGSERP